VAGIKREVVSQGKKIRIMLLKDYGNVLLLIIIAVVMSFLNPRFLSLANIINLSKQMVPTGLLALGLMFVIISGGIDLSAGFGVSLSAVLMGVVFLKSKNLWLALLVTIAVGILMGLLNGLIITKLKILPFITTLATMSIFQGLTYIFSFGRLAWVKHPFTRFLGGGTLFAVPFAFIFLAVCLLLGGLILTRLKLGTYAIAIGNNEESAVLAGIDVVRYKIYLYVLSGICTSLCAIILISRLEMTAPTIGGIPLLLDAIAATIIGGTSLMGGKGSIRGTFIGVVIIILIVNTLNLLNIAPNYRDVFKGLVIIAVLFFDRAVNAESYREDA
jgi:ribose transport system permease protein